MKNKQNPFRIRRVNGKRSLPKKRETAGQIKILLKYAGILLLTVVMTALVYFKEQAGDWFKASVLQAPEPFSGTVMPVDKIPNWTSWKGDQITTHYLSIPADQFMNLPPYDLSLIGLPDESLNPNDPSYNEIVNIKRTYMVVYMGGYSDNHHEGGGSHLAVDIKMPQGTPVKAIANGKVVKMIMQESGFGHHLVIKHVDVPDPERPGKFTTLYSAYNHMADIRVAEGQNVTKGEIVGTSGNTGTSTTPHLHFQIDKESAGWHPYWPFTWQESQDAGLSFFEAVSAGLGTSNARANTINPMQFVMRNMSYNAVAGPQAVPPPNQPAEETDVTEESSAYPEPAPKPQSESPVEEITIYSNADERQLDPSLLPFQLSGDEVSLVNNGVTVVAKDYQDRLKDLSDSDNIRVTVEGVGKTLSPLLRKADFKDGTATFVVKSQDPGIANVIVGKSAHQITFIESVKNAVALKIEHDGNFQKNVVEVVKIIAVDENGNVSPAINFSGQVAVIAQEGQAVITPNRLNAGDFKNGIAEVRVKVPNENRLVLKARNGALVGVSSDLAAENGELFTDVPRNHPNYEAIKTLKNEGIISGYPDGSYDPNKTVNRVEALKMLMLAFKVETGVTGPLPFSDTDNSAWYAATLAAALSKEIVKGYDNGTFRPAQTVNRAEYLKILFNSSGTEFAGDLVAKPYADVSTADWFAAFAYLANKKNIVDSADNLLRPGNGMTRADVAETIYRMKMIEQNNLVSYSR